MLDVTPAGLVSAFGLDDEVMARREKVAGYIHSFAALIVDAFYDDHLQRDQQFQAMLAKMDQPRLKHAVREYLVSLFSDPVDAAFIGRAAAVGVVHHKHGVAPIHVARGFDIVQHVIFKLAAVNQSVQEDLPVILKVLRVAEHLMVEAYLQEERRAGGVSCRGNTLLAAFDRLFRIHAIHRDSLQKIRELWQAGPGRNDLVAAVRGHDGESPVSRLLADIGAVDKLSDAMQLDVAQAQLDHMVYRQTYRTFVARLADGASRESLAPLFNELQRQSDAFLTTVGKPLQDITATSFLAVSSGFRFVQLIAESLFDDRAHNVEQPDLSTMAEAQLPQLLKAAMGWCIEELDVGRDELPSGSHDLVTVIPLRTASLHIGVTLRDLPNRLFLEELLQVMLELARINVLNKERESTLRELAETSDRANRAKDMFLANMSHELRTPLNAIIGFSQILERHKELPAKLAPYIGKIGIAGGNLLHLVNTILDFAKLEAGKIKYEPRQTEFAPIIQEAVLITEPLARAKKIAFEYPEAVAASAVMDPQLIKQVLLNLLSNAVKFTPEGGRVWLDVQVCEHRSAYEVRVGDTGPGIPLEAQRELFAPFTQLDNPMHKSTGGTGLGLSIAKKIIEDLHGGVLEVRSDPGQGSVFTFTLPRRQTELFVRRYECDDADAPRLFIAEDAEVYLDLLVDSLRDRFHLTVTNSVARAKAVLERERFAAHVLDFFLVDGVSTEILRRLEQLKVSAPVIIISAEDDERILAAVGSSDIIEGVFNKRDTELICNLLRGAARTPEVMR